MLNNISTTLSTAARASFTLLEGVGAIVLRLAAQVGRQRAERAITCAAVLALCLFLSPSQARAATFNFTTQYFTSSYTSTPFSGGFSMTMKTDGGVDGCWSVYTICAYSGGIIPNYYPAHIYDVSGGVSVLEYPQSYSSSDLSALPDGSYYAILWNSSTASYADCTALSVSACVTAQQAVGPVVSVVAFTTCGGVFSEGTGGCGGGGGGGGGLYTPYLVDHDGYTYLRFNTAGQSIMICGGSGSIPCTAVGGIGLDSHPTYAEGAIGFILGSFGSGTGLFHLYDVNSLLTEVGSFFYHGGGQGEFSYGTSSQLVGSYILTTQPLNNEIVPTSTVFTFGATGNLDSSDLIASTTKLVFCATRAGAQVGQVIFQPVAIDFCNFSADMVLATSGPFNVSFTRNVQQIGGYVYTIKLQKPLFTAFGLSFGEQTVLSTSTVFIVASTTLQDQLALARLALLTNLSVATSTNAAIDVCNPAAGSGFSPVYCVIGLFVPSPGDFQILSNDLAAITTRGPWGFLGTTFLILKGSYFVPDTTVLPTPTFNLSDTHLAGTSGVSSVELSPWGVLGSSSILSTAQSPKDGKTLRQILEVGWDGFILLIFFLAIFNELVGVGGKAVTQD